MLSPQRPRYFGMHSAKLGVLLLALINLNEVHLSEGCNGITYSKTYPVRLMNETDIASNTKNLSSSIQTTLKNKLPGELCMSALDYEDTQLEITVKTRDSFKSFEDLLLKGLKFDFKNKTNTMMPRSLVFVAMFKVSEPDTNDTFIEQAVKQALGADPVIVTMLATGESENKTMRLWLNMSVSQYPTRALDSLINAVESGYISTLKVLPNSFKAYVTYPPIATKDFEVQFDFGLLKCDKSMSNTSSEHYRATVEAVIKMLNDTYRVLQGFQRVQIGHIQCDSSLVRSVSESAHISAVLKMDKLSVVTPYDVGKSLKSCSASNSKVFNLQVTLLTPNSFQDVTQATITCPSSTTTQPTILETQPPTGPSTPAPTPGKTPRVFVRLRLAVRWSQFCSKLEESLKQNIAKNVYDKKGDVVSPDRVVFINSRKNCVDPQKANDLLDLWFYIAQRSGTDKPSPCVTLKAQRVLKMMVGNGNTKMLGTDFAGKVVGVGLAGCDAHKLDKKDNNMNLTILVIVAVVAGAGLLLLACCCICCGAARRRRRKRYTDKQMELVIVDSAYVQANGEKNKANSVLGLEGDDEKKGNDKNRKRMKRETGGRAAGKYGGGISDDDSDDYYDCCGSGFGSVGGSKRSKRNPKEVGRKKNKEMNGDNIDSNKSDAKDDLGTGNNNDNNCKNVRGNSNEGYDYVRPERLTANDDEGRSGSPSPQSYGNLTYGLGDRKPSNGSDYATIGDPNKRTSQVGDQYVDINSLKGSPVMSAGTTAGLRAGSISIGSNRNGQTPAIITSPAPVVSGSPSTTNNAGISQSDRKGSTPKSGSPVSSRPSSAKGLNNVDDEQLRERRRSSIHSLVDDNAEPLKHKTATVGIVGLALRNKNERKKETEFKNLDKEMPALGTYPASTAGKNRFPDILPNPRSRVKLSTSPDYINASYLHDHKGQRHYIATQHPLVETTDDFWQMVWDQDSHLIVMVNDDENSKQFEYPYYWPTAEGDSMDYNGILVANKRTVAKTDYVVTSLLVTNNKTKPSTSREIAHYRYTSWKDKDQMPNVAMFVGFVVATREIGKKYEDGNSPVTVHCSDGQGFSGVFIALDIGIRSHEESKTSVVDLFELAKRLRQGRNSVFNSLQLYNFAYQCLYEYTVNYDEEAEKKKDVKP